MMRTFATAALVVLTVAIAWSSLTPEISVSLLIPWDKAKHFLGFFGLALLAVTAFPRKPLLWIGLALMAYGGAIEIAQGFVGRDRDLFDWAADGAGILACFAGMAASWARSPLRPQA